ncbi:hypothetical protein C8R42DRAFT_669014 [Lentinula raphanica]|nr:hypothetical protein C8R42DRAFT_669014 [Lentinula raphanica]
MIKGASLTHPNSPTKNCWQFSFATLSKLPSLIRLLLLSIIAAYLCYSTTSKTPMFYDLRFIHLMIIGLILMSADSSPTPLPGSKISKIVQSAKSAPPSDEAWAYMLGLLVETNPDWRTSTNEVVKVSELPSWDTTCFIEFCFQAKFLKAVWRAIDQPDGYLAVDISFMHDRGPLDESLLDKEHATRYSREVAGVEQKQESRLAEVMEKIEWPFPLNMLWDRDWLDHPQTPLTVRYFYNAQLTGDHKYFVYMLTWMSPSDTAVPSQLLFQEVVGLKLPWLKK